MPSAQIRAAIRTAVFEFAKNYPEIRYKKGEKILRPNEYNDHIYIIKEGNVRVYKVLPTGQEIALNVFNHRTQAFVSFGLADMLKDFYIEAIADATLVRIPRSDFVAFMSQQPHILAFIVRDFSFRASEAIKQIEWLSIPDAYTRIKALFYNAAEKIGEINENKAFIKQNHHGDFKLTHHLLASYTGLSRETVTIQINRLIEEGYLKKCEDGLVIEDLARLKKDIYG